MRKIIIAGGGLAGLSLASGLLRRGVPVEVHEAGSYPRHRVCGEFISGVSATTLDELGIRGAFGDARRHRTVSWWREGRKIHGDRLPEPATGISRHVLDRRLRDLVTAAGGVVEEGARMRREAREGLVWAAGRLPAKGGWLGLKCHFHGLRMEDDLEMHLGRNGYAGLAGVEDGAVNVCGLFRVDRSLTGRGPALLEAYLRAGGNEGLADRLVAAIPDPESCCAVAGFRLGRQVRESGLCAVGDAESMIPPFTGNGMSMAFEAAEAALEPLAAWSGGGESWQEAVATIDSRLKRRFRKRLAAARTLHPFLLHPGGGALLETVSRVRLLPFRPLLSLVR